MFLVALIVVAFLAALVGGIWLIVLAFRESVLWGLAAIFVPFGKLAFVVTHWDEAKAPFLTSLGASVVIIGIVFTQPDTIKDQRASHQPARTDAEVLADTGPADVTGSDLLANQRATYARHDADVRTQYARLNAEHAAFGQIPPTYPTTTSIWLITTMFCGTCSPKRQSWMPSTIPWSHCLGTGTLRSSPARKLPAACLLIDASVAR